jgi:hypothetical protein
MQGFISKSGKWHGKTIDIEVGGGIGLVYRFKKNKNGRPGAFILGDDGTYG